MVSKDIRLLMGSSESNAQIGNLSPLEESLNHRCDNLAVEDKFGIYEESNFATARKLAKRILKNNGSFDPKKRSKYLGEMLYNDIFQFLNENNIIEE